MHRWLTATTGTDLRARLEACAGAFHPVDVFTDEPYLGNPVAVVHGAVGIDDIIAEALRIPRAAIVDALWADNGPGWVAVLLRSADEVLALTPGDGTIWVGGETVTCIRGHVAI